MNELGVNTISITLKILVDLNNDSSLNCEFYPYPITFVNNLDKNIVTLKNTKIYFEIIDVYTNNTI